MGKFVRPLQGEILRETRSDQRRTLRLSGRVSSSGEWAQAMIANMSETGLMFETLVDLAMGEIVSVDLPFIGSCDAKIVWNDGNLYGCEFLTPVSQHTISAALLQAPGDVRDSEIESTVEEMPIGIKPTLEELTEWKLEFEQTKGSSGYRLVGFRQAADGMTIAMVSKTN
ncbi:PilZ domain-containing protein [Altererythrobacter sp. BO-6]|uniref:PilZ domain-containing protein n=1 Tax=Altererythrobacter sp. BO-6 TaxID=2604537 RepID=UPI0013E1F918|nr:PilZ domain-containing protein [Altererythrobacter sp. BO-6]QIG53181.1 PilZ domain-containing protein [Altererythrobacter sp. BO-6]